MGWLGRWASESEVECKVKSEVESETETKIETKIEAETNSSKKNPNFNWPGLGPDPSRAVQPGRAGPSPGQLTFELFL